MIKEEEQDESEEEEEVERAAAREAWLPRNDFAHQAPGMAAPASPPAALPPNWHTATAPDGQEYYFNELTRETSWTAPAPQAAAEPGPASPEPPQSIGPTTASPQPISPAAALQRDESSWETRAFSLNLPSDFHSLSSSLSTLT